MGSVGNRVFNSRIQLSINPSVSGSMLVSFPDPPLKRKGGSGEYSTASRYGLAVARNSAQGTKML